ncbi:cryptochrome/photolyase family protein [Subtercola boreus]|uniref:Deoxyribodipyrimidine photolyase n=1 Tax=Subtercola boreus TaxID=120213 RepID=A0A3E0WGI1_9MICO|nr:deoxyribodipyrimidine photo-lyase [Subtercola boreus]RFA23621.1 deoxyribodipyrimidine photolyase [Subtercola boreus]RFA24015.1 deoxyribodipyrimidine photolyase [Subtercola boreus]RFA29713.1 deoxyribodipyrimidine photolyase [Subtercola boreus]
MTSPSIVWFRDDLRVADHPALHAAVERGEPIACVYIFDEQTDYTDTDVFSENSPGIRPLGGAAKWWLHHSLEALAGELAARGLTLTLRSGPAATVMADLQRESEAGAVYWNRRYGLAERELDTAIKASLKELGVEAKSFQANLLFEPWTVQTGQGAPFRVFTPFWRACLSTPAPRHPLPAPAADDVTGFDGASLASDDLADWQFLPTRPDWAAGIRDTWTPGEKAAHADMISFEKDGLGDYQKQRDFPAQDVTSRLSARLRWGELSPFQVWHGVRDASSKEGAASFLREVGWREFAYHLLFHWPRLGIDNMKPAFDSFPWNDPDPEVLGRWQQGQTGIPLVDAGMRELWQTGVMHNRIRMVTASFLIKNLLLDWRLGEAWFWDTLVDADPASNTMNWQWVAGSGADAAPYFRVFNPELQAKKFDGHGEYINQYVPEVGTPAYPEPIVDLGESRKRALAAYETIKGL